MTNFESEFMKSMGPQVSNQLAGALLGGLPDRLSGSGR
jgi:hypothetical protein